MTYTQLKSFSDENNISYDVTVHLGRTLSRINSQSVNIDDTTPKIKPNKIKEYTVKQRTNESIGKLPMHSKTFKTKRKW